MNIEHELQSATLLHQQGRLAEAEAIYRRVLEFDPQQPWALHMLGLAAHQQHRHEEAERLLWRSLELSDSEPNFHFNYALVRLSHGDSEQAQAHLRRTIELQPAHPLARNQLAVLLARAGKTDEAIAQWRAALAAGSQDFHVFNNLAGALAQAGEIDEAMALAQRTTQVAPDRPDAYNTLGNIHVMRWQLDQALAAYNRAAVLAPQSAEVWANMAVALHRAGRIDDAIAAARRALQANPSFAPPHRTLGLIHHLRNDLDDAIAQWQQAATFAPNDPDLLSDLAAGHAIRGELAAANAIYERIFKLRPDHHESRSAYLLALHYDPHLTPDDIAREHFKFGEIHEANVPPPPAFANTREPDRVIRVGYVAPYFRRHAVARFVIGLLRHHDHARFHITCYSDTRDNDEYTKLFRQYADEWHDTIGVTDAELANKIRGDQQDILVDLNGHLAKNRLLMFARKPAPVQATYIAYQNTTGLRAMDYRISDAIADPVGETDPLHTEKLIRLPCFFVYEQPENVDPVAPLPARKNGYVTLGSLNNSSKLNPRIFELWSQVLRRLPDARLTLLVNSRGFAEQVIRDAFARHDIHAARLRLVPRGPQADYFRLYHEIDLALDPFPFSGHTTTCDALWMGVPVVTLAGPIYAARMTASVLANLPMPELITNTPQQYVEKIVSLASDLDALAAMRASLRQRMTDSIICNATEFTRNMETAYRQMWRTWCEAAT